MSRRTALVVSLIGVLAGVGAFIFYRSRTVVTLPEAITTQAAPTAPVSSGPTPLPDSFISPGLVSRRDGHLRIYVAAPPEISLSKDVAEGSGQTPQRLASIPIAVVLENDTYKKVDAANDLALSGDALFTLTISREGPDGGEVFSYSEPQAELNEWQPAERKTFTATWPATSLIPGVYLISLRPSFGAQETVQIRTTVR